MSYLTAISTLPKLSPLDVLVNDDHGAVLCDFGPAVVVREGHSGPTTRSGFKGSMRWCSREVLMGDEKTLKEQYSEVWGRLALEPFTHSSFPIPSFFSITTGTSPLIYHDIGGALEKVIASYKILGLHENARAALAKAVGVYQQSKNTTGNQQAFQIPLALVALAGLGHIIGKTGTITGSGQRFKSPISNFYQTDQQYGFGESIQPIGYRGAARTCCSAWEYCTSTARDRYQEAEKASMEAHEIYFRIRDDLGAANALRGEDEEHGCVDGFGDGAELTEVLGFAGLVWGETRKRVEAVRRGSEGGVS
ncbi:hypothetical protein FRC04_001588 [Tulasnella sp. 424]|nr:hypothetical protein FRC04_001588 [Tulasnella sp. 424]KAG8968636.1 hypothetical protein FRC05_001488 [Tulasnella sp. 425]